MSEGQPQRGDLVVVVRVAEHTPHWLDGTVAEYRVPSSSGRSHQVQGLDMLWGVWVYQVRPCTPEERTAYWLAQAGGGA